VAITIRMKGSEADQELASFYGWLNADPGVRRHARMSLVTAEPGTSDMGAALEIIQLVVDSGFQALNLALAYATWHATRPRRPEVVIESGDTKITVCDAEPETVDAIVRALT
jgi:hypothetical protein